MNKLDKILTIRYNNVKPASGKILLSEPFMGDFYFKRSVVLLADHNEEGSFGLILNKPVEVKFSEVLKDFPRFDGGIYLGGPVQNENIFFLHTLGSRLEDSMEVLDGLWWGGNPDALRDMIANKQVKPADVRFFLGYSGWAAKQLEGELRKHSWIVTTAPANLLLQTPPAHLWSELVTRLGEHYAYWTRFPKDPLLN